MEAREFERPSKEYRSAPFWSWNDVLTNGELVRQIGEMDAQGMGGFFMHSRVGLVTPYMSHEWLDRIRASVAEAKRRGMGAWLYDEDKWPSGFAGGLVTAPDPARRAKALALRPSPVYQPIAEEVATYVARLRDGRIVDTERLKGPPADPFETSPDQLYLHFYLWTSPLGVEWFNGFAYADLLDPETVRAFIEANYEPYWRVVGEEFGQAIPGIFTDEPNYLSHHAGVPRPRVPWTTRLPEVFAAARGYDLLDHLPSLFYDVGDYRAVRYDFWRTVADLFVDSFTRQVGEWCEQHRLRLTGHVLLEDTLLGQTLVVGAAMPHYEYMHMPGMDHLSRNIANPLTAKQLDSAACQLGRRRTLSELFGCSGQNMSFVDRKWIGDWHLVLGVNFLNPHLSLYSMRGARKRDYPPNIFFQQPWWPHNHLLEDYFARLCYALTRGQRIVDVLVIHPIASAWTLYRPEGPQDVMALDAQLATLVDSLLRIHRDFHLGDERILARHGRVEGTTLRVGDMSYPIVVVPPGNTLARSTYRLLAQFVGAGGRLIAIDPAPTLVEGRPAPELDELFGRPGVRHVGAERDALADALAKARAPDVQIAGTGGRSADTVWYHLRRDGDQVIVFLANTDPEQPVEATVTIAAIGRTESWNAATGEIEPLPSESVDGATRVRLRFEPAGSHLVVLDQSASAAPARPARVLRQQPLGDYWQVERLDPNALTLDFCEYRLPALPVGLEGTTIGGLRPDVDPETGWSRRTPVWKAERAIRADFGRSGTAGNWFNVQPGIEQPFALRFRFEVSPELAANPGRLALVVETPDRFDLTLNGVKLPAPADEWWIDPCWRPIDIAGLVRAGENVVQIEGTYFHDTELESCYLIGDFAVEALDGEAGPLRFRLAPDVVGTRRGVRLERQGLPFYAGRLRLSQEVHVAPSDGRIFLEVGQPDATAIDVRVNGQSPGAMAWHPWRVEVSGLLRPGHNLVELDLYTSLHNLLGPHHHTAGELRSVSPGSFSDEVHWTDRYHFVPLGVGGVRLVWEG